MRVKVIQLWGYGAEKAELHGLAPENSRHTERNGMGKKKAEQKEFKTILDEVKQETLDSLYTFTKNGLEKIQVTGIDKKTQRALTKRLQALGGFSIKTEILKRLKPGIDYTETPEITALRYGECGMKRIKQQGKWAKDHHREMKPILEKRNREIRAKAKELKGKNPALSNSAIANRLSKNSQLKPRTIRRIIQSL